MIRTVLAVLSGTDCDLPVLFTSLRALSGENGHIECLRLNPDPAALIAEAAQVDMGSWMIVSDTVTEIEQEAKERTKRAQENLARFSVTENIPTATDPPGPGGVSISWREETGDEFDRISSLARYHDLVVLAGGKDRAGRLPEEALGGIILGSGRPVISGAAKTGNGSLQQNCGRMEGCGRSGTRAHGRNAPFAEGPAN